MFIFRGAPHPGKKQIVYAKKLSLRMLLQYDIQRQGLRLSLNLAETPRNPTDAILDPIFLKPAFGLLKENRR